MSEQDETKPTELRKIPSASAEDMKKFILGVCDNQIFTDRHVPEHENLGMVFMVLALGGGADLDPNDIGCIYEYIGEAGPRSINGLPCFFSCRFLNKKDAEFAFIQIRKEMKRRESLTLQMDLDLDQAVKGREDGTEKP